MSSIATQFPRCKICNGKMIEICTRDDNRWLICELLHGRLHPVPKRTLALSLGFHLSDQPSMNDEQ